MRPFIASELDTGHKTFDAIARKNDFIGTGNVSGNVQLSNYVRAGNEAVDPQGKPCAPDSQRDFDLQMFRTKRMPRHIEATVLEASATQPVILYCYRHVDRKHEVIHGYLLTYTETRQNEFIASWTLGNGKSHDIMRAMRDYVSNPVGTHARFIDVRNRLLQDQMERHADHPAMAELTRLAQVITAGHIGNGQAWRALSSVIDPTSFAADFLKAPSDKDTLAAARAAYANMDRDAVAALLQQMRGAIGDGLAAAGFDPVTDQRLATSALLVQLAGAAPEMANEAKPE